MSAVGNNRVAEDIIHFIKHIQEVQVLNDLDVNLQQAGTNTCVAVWCGYITGQQGITELERLKYLRETIGAQKEHLIACMQNIARRVIQNQRAQS